MKIVFAIFLVTFLVACGASVSPEQQRANLQTLSGIKVGDTLVCTYASGYTNALNIERIDVPVIFGLGADTGAMNSDAKIGYSALAGKCVNIRIITDRDESAIIIGRIILGLPIKTGPDLIVAPNGDKI